MYAYYSWNVTLSESLYSSLQALEVALRNSIYNAATRHFQNPLWFDIPGVLKSREAGKIADAKFNLGKQHKNIDAGRIVAELSFGFWTSVFNWPYERPLLRFIIEDIFPYMPPKIRNRNFLSGRLNKIRLLRNRVYHYEPIWHYYDLKQQHKEILKAIAWIEPATAELLKPVDHFPDCNTQEKLNEIKADLQEIF